MVLYLVIPCYNEEAVLPITAAAVREKMEALIAAGTIGADSRVLFVDDGSKDGTWAGLEQLTGETPLFAALKLAHNVGHQNALLAGLMEAKEHCDAAVSMDADLQDDINAIDGFLAAGKPQQAEEYIRKVRSDIERITPKRYCDNELVNLLCSSFAGKAQRMGVRLEVDAKLPRELSVSDTELCAVLSNALENALRAVSDQPEADRWVTLYCGVRLGKLLVEIQNPCAEGLVMRDGLPVSERAGHGYGCRSIQTIAERRGGLCEFRARGGIFSMQLVLPVKAAAKTQD